MKQTIRISSFQLNAILINFLIGSSIVIGFVKESGNDSWIAVLLAYLYGIFLFLFYCKLFYWADSVSFVQVILFALGKYLGMLFSYAYIAYFIYITARLVTDFAYLTQSTLLTNKSLWILSLIFIITLMFACYFGIEAFARTGEILFFITFTFFILSIMLALINGQFVFNNIQPILGNGWSHVFQSLFPTTITFPIGEMIACTTLFTYVKRNDHFPFKGVISILLLGCILSIGALITMGMLGPELFQDSVYPFLEALKKIYIFNIIQRFDLIGVVIFMIGGFIKATVYFLAAFIIFTDLHPKIKKVPIIITFGVIVLCISINLSKEFSKFLYIGLVKVPIFLHIPFQIIIPLLIALIIFFKKKFFNPSSPQS
ncbi:GerAB/ArcD/ProY family transporter [Gottfriedia acidiceleris]|uniref:GerAB/ArcD/ProY family transporter n=1 Tax=Gottfriedia acidiceleris TaxID=371036 RepID=UPI003D1FCEAD